MYQITQKLQDLARRFTTPENTKRAASFSSQLSTGAALDNLLFSPAGWEDYLCYVKCSIGDAKSPYTLSQELEKNITTVCSGYPSEFEETYRANIVRRHNLRIIDLPDSSSITKCCEEVYVEVAGRLTDQLEEEDNIRIWWDEILVETTGDSPVDFCDDSTCAAAPNNMPQELEVLYNKIKELEERIERLEKK